MLVLSMATTLALSIITVVFAMSVYITQQKSSFIKQKVKHNLGVPIAVLGSGVVTFLSLSGNTDS